MKPAHGLVRGAFLPPHAGHHLLIRTAARACQRVTVQVLERAGARVPAPVRADWLREAHRAQANVQVVATDAALEADAVLAGADVGLGLVPLTSAEVRRDPVGCWEFLEAPVRRHLARRVVIVGAESTGKTTLARELRDSLAARGGAYADTRWVPEWGRDFTLEKLALARAEAALAGSRAPGMDDLLWTRADFVAIAARQNELEEQAAGAGGPVLVCDTDAFATAVWHERYLGARAPEVEALSDRRRRLYLVTHPDDVAFAADEIRDGERFRSWMTGVFLERLRDAGHTLEVLRGSRGERVAQASAALDAFLADGFAKEFVDADPTTR